VFNFKQPIDSAGQVTNAPGVLIEILCQKSNILIYMCVCVY